MPSLEIPVCVVIDMVIITSSSIFFILFVHFDKIMYLTIKIKEILLFSHVKCT